MLDRIQHEHKLWTSLFPNFSQMFLLLFFILFFQRRHTLTSTKQYLPSIILPYESVKVFQWLRLYELEKRDCVGEYFCRGVETGIEPFHYPGIKLLWQLGYLNGLSIQIYRPFYTPLFLQAFLFAFPSFLLSLLLGHWLVFGTSHTQFNHHIEIVRIEN